MKDGVNRMMTLAPKLFSVGHDKVALQMTDVTKSAGGIDIPETAQGKIDVTPETYAHQVVAVGPDCRFLRRGDLVFMVKGQHLAPTYWGGHKVVIALHEEEVVGIVDEPQATKDKRLKESVDKYGEGIKDPVDISKRDWMDKSTQGVARKPISEEQF